MKIKRHLLLLFLLNAAIGLFLPFAGLTIPRLFAVSNPLFPMMAYGGGAILIALSLWMAAAKKFEGFLFGNILGAFILFRYVRSALTQMPDHVNRGIGSYLIMVSLIHLVGFYLASAVKTYLYPHPSKTK